jgi:hypothetical protein
MPSTKLVLSLSGHSHWQHMKRTKPLKKQARIINKKPPLTSKEMPFAQVVEQKIFLEQFSAIIVVQK